MERQEGSLNLVDNFREVLSGLDVDVTREGVLNTPKRWTLMMQEFLKPKPFKFTTFNAEGYDQMIVEKHIPFYSFCEHHVIPFFGTAAIAYIPDKKIVGLSKLARTLEMYASNLQNQERITQQVAAKIERELKPLGVGVVLHARHLCMEMRGVKKPGTITTTSCTLGLFRSDHKTRLEFIELIKAK